MDTSEQQKPLFSLLGTNPSVPQDFCIALISPRQAELPAWCMCLSLALIINMQAPPDSKGENILQNAKWACAQFITKQVRQKIVGKAQKLGAMFYKYSSLIWFLSKDIKENEISSGLVHLHVMGNLLPGSNRGLHTPGLCVAVRAERPHQSTEVCIYLRYHRALSGIHLSAIYSIAMQGFMQNFILNGSFIEDKPKKC